jgi:hypothetical protein
MTKRLDWNLEHALQRPSPLLGELDTLEHLCFNLVSRTLMAPISLTPVRCVVPLVRATELEPVILCVCAPLDRATHMKFGLLIRFLVFSRIIETDSFDYQEGFWSRISGGRFAYLSS